ncbi:MAG TPA: DnaJ domain-containing protein [Dehalococcoidia bacterium]|nr:DnaJ domain-containing protein [Dehalococcoidia bacterium]
MKSDPDYYAILQVDPRAEPGVIQAAYRRLASKHHPDVNPTPEAMERMKLLNAAYDVLSDPGKRQVYDNARPRTRQLTKEGAPTGRRPWWFLVLSVVVLLLLLRYNARLFRIAGPVFVVLWLLMNGQRQRK